MLRQEQQIFEQLDKAKSILITFDKTWNGDAVASALALFLLLKKLGKNVDIAADEHGRSKSLNFLPGFNSIQTSLDNLRKFIVSVNIENAKVGQIKYRIEDNSLNFIIAPKEGFFTKDDVSSKSGDFKYDLIIVMDSPDLESLGMIYDNDTEFFYRSTIINIDHHPHNESFGQINHVELNATSTSEVVYDLINNEYSEHLDEDIATCLLAGIISKTKNFKTSNISPQALSHSSSLISMGARREDIVNKFYRSRPFGVLKLWGRVLARLNAEMNNKIVWSALTQVDFDKTETTEADIPEVIDELMVNIPQARVMMIMNEVKREGKAVTKILLATVGSINAMRFAKKYDPKGTNSMAEFEIEKNIKDAEKEVVEFAKNKAIELSI